jgi:hypothetical protein
MRNTVFPAIFGMVAGALLLAGCGGDEPLTGVGNMPESQVVTQRTIPLTVPPEFGLRPDGTEAEVVAGGTVIDQQETTTLTVATLNATMGEQLLLERSGALNADPLVRAKLNRENALLVGQSAFVEELLFGSFPSGGAAVDLEQGSEIASDVVIEQDVEDSSWIEDAWDSLGQ